MRRCYVRSCAIIINSGNGFIETNLAYGVGSADASLVWIVFLRDNLQAILLLCVLALGTAALQGVSSPGALLSAPTHVEVEDGT